MNFRKIKITIQSSVKLVFIGVNFCVKKMKEIYSAERKANPKGTTATIIFILLLSYFSYHLLSGERGLIALMELSKKVDDSRANLDQVVADRLRLEHRVSLLRDESLDLDLLDEQARRLLGYVGKDDVIYLPPEKKAKN
jgi:cell division protein FtsB